MPLPLVKDHLLCKLLHSPQEIGESRTGRSDLEIRNVQDGSGFSGSFKPPDSSIIRVVRWYASADLNFKLARCLPELKLSALITYSLDFTMCRSLAAERCIGSTLLLIPGGTVNPTYCFLLTLMRDAGTHQEQPGPSPLRSLSSVVGRLRKAFLSLENNFRSKIGCNPSAEFSLHHSISISSSDLAPLLHISTEFKVLVMDS